MEKTQRKTDEPSRKGLPDFRTEDPEPEENAVGRLDTRDQFLTRHKPPSDKNILYQGAFEVNGFRIFEFAFFYDYNLAVMKRSLTTRIVEFTETWRISRVIMLTFITAATAYGFRAESANVVLTTLTAFFLSLGGFYMDHLSDAVEDRRSNKKRNPIATGLLPKKYGIAVVAGALVIAAVCGFILNPFILLPVLAVVLVLLGLGSDVLGHPFRKAFSLGSLQAFYALIGGISSSNAFRDNGMLALVLVALFLFLAMTGGKVLGDIRDLPFDRKTSSRTIPKNYGVPFSVAFYLIFETGAYAVGLGTAFTGFFSAGYAVCMALIAVIGSLISVFFLLKPVPERADLANRLSLMVLGSLYAAGMILGRA